MYVCIYLSTITRSPTEFPGHSKIYTHLNEAHKYDMIKSAFLTFCLTKMSSHLSCWIRHYFGFFCCYFYEKSSSILQMGIETWKGKGTFLNSHRYKWQYYEYYIFLDILCMTFSFFSTSSIFYVQSLSYLSCLLHALGRKRSKNIKTPSLAFKTPVKNHSFFFFL